MLLTMLAVVEVDCCCWVVMGTWSPTSMVAVWLLSTIRLGEEITLSLDSEASRFKTARTSPPEVMV